MVRSMPLATLALGLAVPAAAIAAPERGFSVHFAGCSEFAGVGPVGLAQAQPLVPAGYIIAGASSGQASIVVRVTQCASGQVEGSPAVPTTLSQIGINVVSPDGTGTINNYTLVYVSNNPFLVQAFVAAGVPARFDPNIVYEYTLNAAGTGGDLYAAVPDGGVPAYFFYGPEGEPPANSQQLFIANWWYGPRAAIKQQGTYPAISFGSSNVTFYTSKQSELGKLIGGNADGTFTGLTVHGEYPSADLVVSVAREW